MSTENIDWSKAPKGATHFQAAENEGEIDVFWRVTGGVARQIWRLTPWREDPRDHVETFTYGPEGCDGFDASRAVARPIPWDGKGLPPVGTICKLAKPSASFQPLHPQWAGREVKIYSHFTSDRGLEMAAYVSPDHMIGGCGVSLLFEPVPTAEQIAAEAREASVKQMMKDVCCASSRDIFEDLYDAGYRKTEGGVA